MKPKDDLRQLCTLLESERDAVLTAWRMQVCQLPSAAGLDVPELNDHVPELLKELVTSLKKSTDEQIEKTLIEGSSVAHGLQRLSDGFDLQEVVTEYSILRTCLHELAEANDLTLCGETFRVVNRVIDGAIALAVETYATQQALQVQQRRQEHLAFVAHDLRTPLSAMSLAARYLEAKASSHSSDPDTLKMLATLQRNARQLELLVKKILDENSEMQTEVGSTMVRRRFDLWPLVESLIHDLHPVADTGSTKLINEVPTELVATGDASLVRRIFQNLIANAIRYTPRGAIIIGARQLPDDAGVECWVRDNGSGIPADQIEHVFEESVTDPLGQGTGLGLAIVKTFVTAHEGEVRVDSTAAGSNFSFTLPAAVK
jgi:signal transduction histidine kinase